MQTNNYTHSVPNNHSFIPFWFLKIQYITLKLKYITKEMLSVTPMYINQQQLQGQSIHTIHKQF